MRIILIDPENQTVAEQHIEPGLQNIYKVLDCRMIESPYIEEIDPSDAIYCDEEALLNPHKIKGGFMFKGWYFPFVGKALIVGTDEEVGDIDCVTDINVFTDLVWVSQERCLHYANNIPDPIIISW